MPVYDFKCSKCGNRFEKFTFKTKDLEVNCEICGSEAKKLISPVGIIFKGPGFYITDSKKSSSIAA